MIYAIGTGEKFFASISLQYPPNSTCTCTKDNYSYTAQNVGLSKDKNGNEWSYYTFLVPEAGKWTITISDGVNKKTLKADVTEQYESVLIEKINFRRYIWNLGAYDAETKGFSTMIDNNIGVWVESRQSSSGTWEGNASTNKTKSPIDISRYSKLIFNLVKNAPVYNGGNGRRIFGIQGIKTIEYSGDEQTNSIGEKKFDLTQLSAEALKSATIYFYGHSGNQSAVSGITNYNAINIFADKIWVE